MFFYPAAMTPGCTLESCDFRDSYQEFTDAGYEIVGVSPDSPARNAKFKVRRGSTSTCSPIRTRHSPPLSVLGAKRPCTGRRPWA
jgi:alkyl hydroperoxide reductase subunit AhpC